MPLTYNAYSIEATGYITPVTEVNTDYIGAFMVQKWLNNGKTQAQILLSWNAGTNARACSKGINKKHIKYDSCAYVANGLQTLADNIY